MHGLAMVVAVSALMSGFAPMATGSGGAVEIGPYKQDLSRLSGENGKIISNTKLDLSRNSGTVNYYRIIYKSDGLKIEGFVIIPKNKTGKMPAVIYNRGGNRSFGEVSYRKLMWLSNFSRQGYVILASQYREGGDSEGREEFGGADVNDVLNLAALAKSLPIVDGNRIGMLGFSRGGMMTYLAIKKGAEVKAAVVIGGVTDVVQWANDRGSRVYDLLGELIGYDQEKWRERSVTSWPHEIRIPLLIMHGEDDMRVDVSLAEELAKKLKELYEELDSEFRFVKFEGGDHFLRSHARRRDAMTQRWFDKHLGN